MNRCPHCDYFVPSAWDECRRCGASLVAAQAVVPQGAPSATRITRQRIDLTPTAQIRSAVPRPFDARTPVPSRSEGAAQRRGFATRMRLPVVGPLSVIVMVASVAMGWNHYSNPSVPAALQPWMQHHVGVTFRPAGAGFSVSLPSQPTESFLQLTFWNGLTGIARVARSHAGIHEVSVVWMRLPSGVLERPGVDPAQAAADLAGQAGGFHVQVPTAVHHHGMPAIDAEIIRNQLDGRALIVVNGDAIVAVFVTAPHDAGAGFDFLVRSLLP